MFFAPGVLRNFLFFLAACPLDSIRSASNLLARKKHRRQLRTLSGVITSAPTLYVYYYNTHAHND
jgi:hypothetical protein